MAGINSFLIPAISTYIILIPSLKIVPDTDIYLNIHTNTYIYTNTFIYMHIRFYKHIHTYTYIYVYSGIYLRIHAYTFIYIIIHMNTSINRDILTIYMHIHTLSYRICMYMYVYNGFSFLLASQARLGNERAGEEGRSGISLAKRYSK